MKISIITAAFNSAETIADTMESVLAQTYGDIEYIVVDGASKDQTMDIVKSFEPRFEGRMKWISETDRGIYDAMNKGIKAASGDIVGTLNSDDMLASNDVIEKVSETIITLGADCVYGRLNLVDNKDGAFLKGWHPAHPTFYTYKKFFEKFGYYRTDLKIAADFELMMRFIEKNKITGAFIDKLMVNQRAGGVSTKLSGYIRSNLEIINAFKLNGIRPPLLCVPRKVLPKLANTLKNRFLRK